MAARQVYKRFMIGACVVTGLHYAGYRCMEGIWPDDTEKVIKAR